MGRVTILVNGRFLAARPTGLHRAARGLVRGGRAAGLDLEVVAPSGVDDPLVDRTVWSPPGRAGRQAWEQLVLPLVAGRRLVLSPVNTAPLAVRRSAVVVHDLAPIVGPHWYRRQMRLYGQVVVTAARRAEIVITDSTQVAGELAAIGVGSARVHVVRPAVADDLAPADPATVDEVRGRHRLDRPYVLHLGWADPRKDAATLVAAHLLAARRCPHDLVLAGATHPTFAPVSIPSAPTIRQLGYVRDGDLPALLTGAAVFAYPSRYEGFGLPPLEAMTCGTPAVVADVPSVREATGGQAVYVPPGDVTAWADALCRALAGLPPQTPPAWTWRDAGEQLALALAVAETDG